MFPETRKALVPNTLGRPRPPTETAWKSLLLFQSCSLFHPSPHKHLHLLPWHSILSLFNSYQTSQALGFYKTFSEKVGGAFYPLRSHSAEATFLSWKISSIRKSITDTGKVESKTIPLSAFTFFLSLQMKMDCTIFKWEERKSIKNHSCCERCSSLECSNLATTLELALKKLSNMQIVYTAPTLY